MKLDRERLLVNLRSAARGVAADPFGTRNGHLRVLWDDETTMKLDCDAALQLATGKPPTAIAEGLGIGRLTALLKDNGKVRGIVTGNAHRRLVAKTLAQQFGTVSDGEKTPYQLARALTH